MFYSHMGNIEPELIYSAISLLINRDKNGQVMKYCLLTMLYFIKAQIYKVDIRFFKVYLYC